MQSPESQSLKLVVDTYIHQLLFLPEQNIISFQELSGLFHS